MTDREAVLISAGNTVVAVLERVLTGMEIQHRAECECERCAVVKAWKDLANA